MEKKDLFIRDKVYFDYKKKFQYKLLDFYNEEGHYTTSLVETYPIEDINPQPYIVCTVTEIEEDGRLHWGQGIYFNSKASATKEFERRKTIDLGLEKEELDIEIERQ